MALITSLLMSVILLILGVSFLTYLGNDYRFAARQEKSQQAYYLALAGLEFQKTRTDLLHPSAANVSLSQNLPSDDSTTQSFQVTVCPDGQIISVGTVQTPVAVLAQRTLVVNPGKPAREYRDSTL